MRLPQVSPRLSIPAAALALAFALGLAGCGADSSPPDATVADDGAIDDGPTIDGPTIDARPIDARPIDAMADAAAAPPLNGCTLATAMDRTAVGASRTISFPGTSYSPKCIKIKLGQTVTWSGAFGSHPLRAGAIENNTPTAQPGNPIPSVDVGNSRSVTFNAVGEFGYYCDFHWPGGMTGAIYVVL